MEGYVKTSLPFIFVDVNGNMIQKGKTINQVSNKGVPYTRSIKDRVVKGYDNGIGYLQVKCCFEGDVYRKYLHNLVWEAFNGGIPDGVEINHIDHDKYNCALSNLELMSHKDNIKAMMDYYGIRKKQKQLIYPIVKTRQYDISEMCWLVYSLGWEGSARLLEVGSGNAVKRIIDSKILGASRVIRKFKKPIIDKNKRNNVTFTKDDINYICSVYKPNHREYGSRSLGRMYGVTHTTILGIVNKHKD